MVAEEILKLIANLAILTIGAVLLTFIVVYGVFFNWRQTEGGRSVMYFVCSLELLILLAAFLNWVDIFSPETEQLLRVEVYLMILAAGSRLLWVLFRHWTKIDALVIDVPARRRDTGSIPTVDSD